MADLNFERIYETFGRIVHFRKYLMRNRLHAFITILQASILLPLPLQASEWQQIITQDGITISQRSVPGKTYKQTQGVAVMPGTIAPLVAIIQNGALCTQWLNYCRSSKTVKNLSPTERVDYTVMDAPYLFKDRDMYIRSIISYDSTSRTATIELNGLDDYGPVQAGKVRVLSLRGYWRFQQVNEQQVKMDYQIYSNPRITPASAVNRSSPKGVFKTFTKLHQLASSPKFRHIKFDPARLRAITVQ